jgi:hypothetical protein
MSRMCRTLSWASVESKSEFAGHHSGLECPCVIRTVLGEAQFGNLKCAAEARPVRDQQSAAAEGLEGPESSAGILGHFPEPTRPIGITV